MNKPNPSGVAGSLVATDPQVAALWEQLHQFKFDRGSGPRSFASRLAQEQGWSAEFAARAIGEYRRFLLLFALSEQGQEPGMPGKPATQVVPSAVVDKAWHLHLLYTQSYWDDLCRDILHTELHHHPADGSGGEALALDAVYRANMEAYQAVFGEPAPLDIWPAAPAPSKPASANTPIDAVLAREGQPGFTFKPPFFRAVSLIGFILLVLFSIFIRQMPKEYAGLGGELWLLCGVFYLGTVYVVGAATAIQNPGWRSPKSTRRRRVVGSAGKFGFGCSGGGSTDGSMDMTGGHGHHSGSHDSGGSGHSCGGGHGCGGHGCGGHGCGGGGCGGGH